VRIQGVRCWKPINGLLRVQKVVFIVVIPRESREGNCMKIYRFMATYAGFDEVYRLIDISEENTLDDLHAILFNAFDYGEDHLYSFFLSRQSVVSRRALRACPHFACETMLETMKELPFHNNEAYSTQTRIGDLDLKSRQVLYYLFDYGEENLHKLKVKQIWEAASGEGFPEIIESIGSSFALNPEDDDDGLDWKDDDMDDEYPVDVESDGRDCQFEIRMAETRSSLLEFLLKTDNVPDGISKLCSHLDTQKKPVPIEEIYRLLSILMGTPPYARLERGTTLSFWNITAGRNCYSAEDRLNMAFYFLSGRFTRMKTDAIYQKIIEMPDVSREQKRTFSDHLLKKDALKLPPYYPSTEEILEMFKGDLTIPDELSEKVSDKEIKQFLELASHLLAREKYFPPVVMPDSSLQYAAYWSLMLSNDPAIQLEASEASASHHGAFSRQSIILGLVNGISTRHSDLNEKTIRDFFQRCLQSGNGQVRKKVYSVGWHLFGVQFVKPGLHDTDAGVRREVSMLVNRATSGVYSSNARQQSLF